MTASIQITFSNGQKFEIPSLFIFKARATHFANHDEGERTKENMLKWDDVFDNEMNTADPSDALDWIQNNMNWSDVKNVAKRLPSHDHDVDFEKEFTSAKFEVLEIVKN